MSMFECFYNRSCIEYIPTTIYLCQNFVLYVLVCAKFEFVVENRIYSILTADAPFEVVLNLV